MTIRRPKNTSLQNSKPARRPARGMAVLLVLGLLAITLAVSYATLRTQATAIQLARNTGRSLDARLAAESGLAAAMHKISDSSWAGVDVPLGANITDDSWYEVSFSTGDPELLPTATNYGEYPYRLTITSTGYAADPANPDIRAIHRVRSVVQLARAQMVADPANWTSLTGFTIYQWANRAAIVQFPFRSTGPVTILGKLYLTLEYPQDGSARDQYLNDLRLMRSDGRGDHRPFGALVTIAYLRQDAATLNQLTTQLGLTTADSLASTTAPVSHPGGVGTYRLYPGGKDYTPPILQDIYGATIQDVTLAPDPATNPLGVFRSRGSLTVKSNVQIRGTLITNGTSPTVNIEGTNVVLQSADLPLLEGSTQRWQLPVALVKEDLKIYSGSDAQIKGAALVWDDFEIRNGTSTTPFALTGSLAAAGLQVRGRTPWKMTSSDWDADHNEYLEVRDGGLLGALLGVLNSILSSLGLGSGDELFFPEFMQWKRGFNFQPILTIKPDSSGVRSHWHDWTRPIFEKAPNDPGLRWNLIRYEDGV